MNYSSKFTPADLRQLCEVRGDHLLSFYLPTERPGAQAAQNRLRLKGHLEAAQAELRDRGLGVREIREQFSSLAALVDSAELWKSASDGLALFAAPQQTWMWRLPVAFRELRWVGPRFVIKPLAPLAADGEFLTLSISGQGVQLYRGDRWEFEPVPADLPPGLPEALNYIPVDGTHQSHGAGATVFHGQGGLKDVAKDEWRNYFRLVERAVWPQVRNSQAPLVFVGVDYLFPIYQEINRYPHLAPTQVAGSPESISTHELANRAREAAAAARGAPRQKDAEALERNRGSNRASVELAEIVQAADAGRVEAAFVALDVERWGRVDVDPPQVTRHAEPEADSEELLDRIAAATLRTGGRVYVEPIDQLPERQPASALFRYA